MRVTVETFAGVKIGAVDSEEPVLVAAVRGRGVASERVPYPVLLL